MITEKDFAEAISEYFDEGERTVPEYQGKTEAQVMFELAKRMAIDFAEHILKEGTVARMDKGWWNGGKTYTSEQLFELYQQQKQ